MIESHLSDDQRELLIGFGEDLVDYQGRYDDASWKKIKGSNHRLYRIQKIVEESFGVAIDSTQDTLKLQSGDTGSSGEKTNSRLVEVWLNRKFHPNALSGSAHTPDGQDSRLSVCIAPNQPDIDRRRIVDKSTFVRWDLRIPAKDRVTDFESSRATFLKTLHKLFSDVNVQSIQVADTTSIQTNFRKIPREDLADPDVWFNKVVAGIRTANSELDRLFAEQESSLRTAFTKVGFVPKTNGASEPTGSKLRADSQNPAARRLLDQISSTTPVILQGPPGTGKTYRSRSVIKEQIRDSVDDDRYTTFFQKYRNDQGNLEWPELLGSCQWSHMSRGVHQPHFNEDIRNRAAEAPVIWEMVQLHPGYAYEDFVRGMGTSRGGGVEFEPKDRVLVQLAEVARMRGSDRPVILVLDEINRCNLSSVLGELIAVLEKDKRTVYDAEGVVRKEGWPVRLQYPSPDGSNSAPSRERNAFQMPDNLWILGTMNTADRSLALVDYAIRRRFRFVDIVPSEAAVENYYRQFDDQIAWAADAADIAVRAFQKFTDVVSERRLSLGHSYFLVNPRAAGSASEWLQKLADKIVFEVIPLLREYQQEGRLAGNVRSLAFDGHDSNVGFEIRLDVPGYTLDRHDGSVIQSQDNLTDLVKGWLVSHDQKLVEAPSWSDMGEFNKSFLDDIYWVTGYPSKYKHFDRQWNTWGRFNFVSGGGTNKSARTDLERLGVNAQLTFAYIPKSIKGYVGIAQPTGKSLPWSEFLRQQPDEARQTLISELDNSDSKRDMELERFVPVEWLVRVDPLEQNALTSEYLKNRNLRTKAGRPLPTWNTVYSQLFDNPDHNLKKICGGNATALPFDQDRFGAQIPQKAPYLLTLLVRAFEQLSEAGKTSGEFDRKDLPNDFQQFIDMCETKIASAFELIGP